MGFLRHAIAKPADPATTVSATLVMAGIGFTFVPSMSGKCHVVVSGAAFDATATDIVTLGGRYGTGKPPANGDAVSGTRFGAATDLALQGSGTTAGVGFTLADIVSLTPGQNYWFDLAFSASAGHAANLKSISCTLLELP